MKRVENSDLKVVLKFLTMYFTYKSNEFFETSHKELSLFVIMIRDKTDLTKK